MYLNKFEQKMGVDALGLAINYIVSNSTRARPKLKSGFLNSLSPIATLFSFATSMIIKQT